MLLPTALAALATLSMTPLSMTTADPPSSSRVIAVKLRDGGVAVRVELGVTCPAGAHAGLTVTVTEANGTRIAQGSRTGPADCTGGPQEVALRVNADPAGAPFVRGPATARTVRTVCAGADCATTPFDETIRITK